jgi:hypothetical protein
MFGGVGIRYPVQDDCSVDDPVQAENQATQPPQSEFAEGAVMDGSSNKENWRRALLP